jgi:hypothetical protein
VTAGAIPGGTKAIRKSDSAVAVLDASGCYEFKSSTVSSGFLARSLAEGDSVQLYNDSALFAITLPYITAGDTVNVVPTLITLQDVPNAEVDSVHLVVYDKVHILSRKVKLRRAKDGDISSFSRTLWSRDDGSYVQVHFQINGVRKFASSVYEIEPGAAEITHWNKIKVGSVPALIHGAGSFVQHVVAAPLMGVIEHDTTFFAIKSSRIDTIVDTSIHFVSFQSKSIYGIQTSTAVDIDVSNTEDEVALFPVSLRDSAGYVTLDTVRIVRTGRKVVSTNPVTPVQVDGDKLYIKTW